ncbi:beta-lactamase-like protein [Jimgerdemannia flammicorona]|uniref:hydroxyacylglutathione hydrolase n=1 Tax=Jimgerdemannia flammicorona TaxID=994334 RepID=A0A433QL02_9FUNG|nr:beta-lactamase-like protein [Jimgerdemannia flammicorona]
MKIIHIPCLEDKYISFVHKNPEPILLATPDPLRLPSDGPEDKRRYALLLLSHLFCLLTSSSIFSSCFLKAALVDPAEPSKVLPVVGQAGVNLTSILTTHHHSDHAGGNKKILAKLPDLRVFGGDNRIEGVTNQVKDREEIRLGSLKITALWTVCHTMSSVSYYVEDEAADERAVFTGDTLFIGGCGKFFEGTHKDMYNSLINVLGSLPPDTLVYCGHEYTRSNLRFAVSVDPHNEALHEKIKWAAENKVTVPGTIGEEKHINPFLRVDVEEIKKATKKTEPVEVLGSLREMKNRFRG